MGKIIINHGDIEPEVAISYVEKVIEGGRVSKGTYGMCFCFVTSWKNGMRVYADRTPKGTDTFWVRMGDPDV